MKFFEMLVKETPVLTMLVNLVLSLIITTLASYHLQIRDDTVLLGITMASFLVLEIFAFIMYRLGKIK